MKDKNKENSASTALLTTRRSMLKTSAILVGSLALPNLFCSEFADFNDKHPASANPCVSFEITFSKPMDTPSVEAALTITPDVPEFFDGTFTWSVNDTVLYYKHDIGEIGQNYNVTVGAAALDKTGSQLDGNDDGVGGDEYSFDITVV